MGDKESVSTISGEIFEDEDSEKSKQTDIGIQVGKQKQVSTSEFDAYKGLTALEKSVIKKVYKILDSQKDLAPSIREKLKAKMVKKLTKK